MKKNFFSGLVILFPVFITTWIVAVLVRLSTKPFKLFVRNIFTTENLFQEGFWIFSKNQVLDVVTTLTILVGIFFILFLIGFIGRWLLLHSLVHLTERIVLRIPFINKIYKACRDVTNIVFSNDNRSFTKVAWAPFPTSNQRALGLITNDREFHIAGKKELYLPVLLPGTPNPTVGFLLLCPKSSVEITNIRVDEAMKWIISCGSSEARTVVSALLNKKNIS